ncbi:MAG: TonB-dependent receptor family protein [Clostridia bacterium]
MVKASVAVCATVACTAAFAQDEGVVVSATRAPRPALDVPASVDRVYGEDIRDGRPQVNLSESLARVPGITVQNRQNYAQDLQIQSRGFGARSTFGVRGIRMYSDGIPATMPDGQGQAGNFDLGSARSIEVLRGPFSTLYGASSGGVILVETENGPEEFTVEPSLYLGSYGMHREAFKAGGTWGPVNAIGDVSHFHTDGYRDHSAANRDLVNGKLRYSLGEDDTVTLVANSLRQPQTQDPQGLTRTLYEQNPRQVVAPTLQFNTRKTVYHDQLGGTFTHRLDGGAALHATAYYGERWQEQYLGISANGVTSIDRGFGGGALRYASSPANALRFYVGAELDFMHDRRKNWTNLNGVQGPLSRNEDNEAWSTGIYAQAEWKLSERWIVNGGARYTNVRFRNHDLFLTDGDGSGDRTYNATTPVLGVVYKLTSLTSAYANTGRGFETPTFTELANPRVGQGLNFALDASKSTHYEVGIKTVRPGWGRLNAALFSVATQNEIVVDQNVGGKASFKNVGHTDRAGLELAAETLTGGPFEGRIAYTRMRAEYRDTFSTQVLTTGPQVTVQAGSTIAGVPRTTLYGELAYRREPFFARLESYYRSNVAANDPNTEFADAYLVSNFVTGFTQLGSQWRLTEFFRVDNLADKTYVGSVIVNEGNARYYEPSPRRNMTLGLQANLRF